MKKDENMQDLRTLEDMRLYLEEQNQLSINNTNELIELYNKYLDWLNSNFYLTDDEIEYVMPIKKVFEEQSNSKTMINSTKAKQILLKWKKK